MKKATWFIIIFVEIIIVEALFLLERTLGNGYSLSETVSRVDVLTIWAAVITIVFLVFSVIGLLDIDRRIKEVDDIKEKQTAKFREIEESSREIIESSRDAKRQIVEQAEKEVKKILNKSTNRQNYFDQITGINNEMFPDRKVLAFTNFLRETKEVEGIDFAYIYLGRGNAYLQMHKFKEAKNDFEMAIEICQLVNKEKAYTSLAGYYVAVKDYEHSIEYFLKALELNPQSAPTCMDIGNSYNAMGKFDEAKKYYERALTFNPDLADIYYNKAVQLKDEAGTANWEQKMAYLDKCIEINPMFINAHVNKAGLLREKGDNVAAAAELSSVIEKVFDPELINAIEQRGITHRLNGNQPKALGDFMFVQVFQPNNIQNLANLSAVCLEMGRAREADYYAIQGLNEANSQNNHTCDGDFQQVLAFTRGMEVQLDVEEGERMKGDTQG